MTKKNNENSKKIKICLVGSSGGHLTHLFMLKPFWKDKDHFWVTFDKEDARSLLDGEKIYPCYFPTNRSIKALIKNTFIALKVLRKEKPDLIISSGAAVAVPFFYLGKLMGSKLIYIEVFDRIDKPTMTGKIVYHISDKFIVQWEEMKKVYPKAINLGSIF
ncbi:MAG: PssD/Cps14F family polysaccharide biosynthesis glycosyltransferase [Anaerococcus vaginalis]|nr:PssD/Cps14F family polysaccharide biosynthesis glycosyltransferase [Anaerococcus vaginalis]